MEWKDLAAGFQFFGWSCAAQGHIQPRLSISQAGESNLADTVVTSRLSSWEAIPRRIMRSNGTPYMREATPGHTQNLTLPDTMVDRELFDQLMRASSSQTQTAWYTQFK